MQLVRAVNMSSLNNILNFCSEIQNALQIIPPQCVGGNECYVFFEDVDTLVHDFESSLNEEDIQNAFTLDNIHGYIYCIVKLLFLVAYLSFACNGHPCLLPCAPYDII